MYSKYNMHEIKFQQNNLQFQELEEEIEETKLKLICAEKLINGLGGEKVRWTELVQNLDETYDNIIGDVLLSSSVVAYLAPFTPLYREVSC